MNQQKTEYTVTMHGPGLQKAGTSTLQRTDHKFRISLHRNYPYAGSLEVTWLTPIFHPNIRPTDGKVCIVLLTDWAPSQTILSVVQSVEHILSNPNPASPLDWEAAKYFKANPDALKNPNAHEQPPRGPRIVNWR